MLMSVSQRDSGGWVQRDTWPAGRKVLEVVVLLSTGIVAMALCGGAEQWRTVGHRGEWGS